MSSRAITLLTYLAFVSAGVALEVAARLGASRIPTIGAVLSRVMRSRSGRVGIIAGWAWLGLHFFAR